MAGSTWPSWRAAATLTDIIADVKKAMPLNEVDEHLRGKCHFKKAGGQSGQCSAETGAGAGMCLILPPPLHMRNIYLYSCVKCRHNTVVIVYKISFSCKLQRFDKLSINSISSRKQRSEFQSCLKGSYNPSFSTPEKSDNFSVVMFSIQ